MIRHPQKKALDIEFEAKFNEWQGKQTPLARATDKLESSTAKIEQDNNNAIYEKMHPFNRCGKFDLRFMEETFGYTNGVRSMRIARCDDRELTQEEIDD